MTAITLDSVTKVYADTVLAVSNLSLQVADGELMVLLGPSGCGKSTVLRMIAGLEQLTEGDLWFDDLLASDLPPKQRGVAMVFQNGALYPNRTVRGNIMFPLKMVGENPDVASAKAAEMARVLGIEKTLERMPWTLSGGQRQRVAIGRAIIRQPSVFLMDEPLSNLDATMRTELRHEIGAMSRDLGVTTVYVTHDQIEALALADRIAIMREGRLEDVGTPAQVFDDPATAFVAGFLGTPRINLLAATVQVAPERRVLLHLGDQTLALPPDDHRAAALAEHNGERVVLGVRSDALSPATDDGRANRLTGRLRTLEYHGHQWVAYIETGLDAVNPDAIGLERHSLPANRHGLHRGGRRRHRLRKRVHKLLGRTAPVQPAPAAAGIHRRSDLVLEVDGRVDWQTGTPVHLHVDLSRVHLFDQHGHRLDPVSR